MKVIGLTGGIASGKSTASEILSKHGIHIIDADLVAREIVEPGQPALDEITAIFGKEVLDENGCLKRSALARIVFNDTNKLEKLNQITHRRIIERVLERIQEAKELNQEKVIVFDAALLIELKLTEMVDEVWLVVVDLEHQIRRLMARENMCREDALKIIEAQMSLEEKKAYSDVLINNSGTIDEMRHQLMLQLKRVMEEQSE